MQTVPSVFQSNGSLPDKTYLPGLSQWPEPVRLTQALAVVAQPFAGTLLLWLEVGGSLTGDVIELEADGTWPGGGAMASLDLNETVLAGQAVRWRGNYSGTNAQAPEQVQVTLVWEPFAQAVVPDMAVGWLDGAERLPLWEYDPTTEEYTDVSNGLAAGRASIRTDHGWSLFVGEVEALRIQGGVLYAVGIADGDWPDPTVPGVQFTVGGVPWLTVTAAWIWVGHSCETGGDPLPTEAVQFAWSGAALTVDGLFAASLVEGMPK